MKQAIVNNVKHNQYAFHGHLIVENYLTVANRTFMDLGSHHIKRIGVICRFEFLANAGCLA